jgi:hypothetical protein
VRYQHASEMKADLKRLERDSSSGGVAIAKPPPESRRPTYRAVGIVLALLLLAGPDPSIYVFTKTDLQRNLFRIPLH